MTFKEYIKVNDIEKDVVKIDCSYSSLTDLNGIEMFTDLKVLYCDDNSLTQLPNLDKMVNLTHLYCHDNVLTELQI